MRVLGIFDCLEQRPAQLHRVKRCWLIKRLGIFEIIVIQKLIIFIVVNLNFDDWFVGSTALVFLALFPLSVGRANANIVDFLNYEKLLQWRSEDRTSWIKNHPNTRQCSVQCYVFWLALRCFQNLKAGQNTFFPFSIFLEILDILSDFSFEKPCL